MNDFELVRAELSEILATPIDDLGDSAILESFANWDSLSKVTLIGYLIDKFSAPIDVELLESVKTIGELRSLLERLPQYAQS
jgi:acyl carrier protein